MSKKKTKKKKKIKTWNYILFGLIAAAIYAFFYWNGVNLISLYSKEIGTLLLLVAVKFADKHFGWNLSFLMKEETKEKAGEAVKTAQKKANKKRKEIGVKIEGWIRAKWAAEKFRKDTGYGRLKSRIVTQEIYRKMKKENPDIFKKEER